MEVTIITHVHLERGHIVMLCTEHMASVGEQQQRGDHLTMTLVVRVSIYLSIASTVSIVSTVSTVSIYLQYLHMPRPQPRCTAGHCRHCTRLSSLHLLCTGQCVTCASHTDCHCPALHNNLHSKYFNTISSQNHLSLPVLVLCTKEKELVPIFTTCRTAHV